MSGARRLRLLISALSAIVLLASACSGDELDGRLSELLSQKEDYVRITERGVVTSLGPLEKKYLDLLSEYPSAEDAGRIYFALTDLHCQSALTDPDAAIRYAQKAFECPLDDSLKIRLCHKLGDAMQVKNRGVTGPALAEARREIVRTYLEGIKIALSHHTPPERVEITGPGLFTGRITDPEVAAARRREYEEQLAAMQQARFINDMVMHRDICVNQIVYIYSRKPYDTEGLRAVATEILADDEAVADLIEKVEAAVRERTAKEMEKLTDEFIEGVEAELANAPEAAPAEPAAPADQEQAPEAAPVVEENQAPSPPVWWFVGAAAVVAAAALLYLRRSRRR